MPTFGSPILPNVSGLALGSASQPWAVFATSVSLQNIISLSANPATAGAIRLGGTDLIEWRNSANTGNLTLGPSGVAAAPFDADLLSFSGNGIKAAEFVSPTLPSTTGLLRLSDADTISWRNHLNTGNVSILHNVDDTLTLPPTIIPTVYTTTTNASTINAITINASTNVITDEVQFGGITAAFPMIKRNAAAISVLLADDSALADIFCGTLTAANISYLTKYGGQATLGTGLPSIVALVDASTQTAAIGSTLFFASPAMGVSECRLSWNAKINTIAGVSSTLGPLTISYTDTDTSVQTITCAAQIAAGTIATTSTGNTTTTVLLGIPIMLNIRPSTNVTYSFGYASNAAAAMAYTLHIRLESM